MRLAVISDIHGNLLALEAVLADIKARGADAAVNLGDCVTSPLWPRETCELLESLALPTVRGNHDRQIDSSDPSRLQPAGQHAHAALTTDQRRMLSALPARIELSGEILAVHGTPDDDSTYLIDENAHGVLAPAPRALVEQRLGEAIRWPVVLCGHSHNQGFRLIADRCLVLNPGSAGCPVFVDNKAAPRLEYRSPHARYALLTRRNGRWDAELFALAYDWEAAARQAAANGRPDWAVAMTTGTLTQ